MSARCVHVCVHVCAWCVCLVSAASALSAASPEHEPVTEVTGTVGKSVTFRIPGPMEGRLYWHVKNLLMVIINSSGYPEVLDAKYAERMAFLHNGTALILSGLVPDDAGTYWVQVATKRRYIFNLRVYAELPPPAVSCSLANCTAAPCPYELLCSAPGAAVAYGWSGAGALNASGPWLQLRRPLRSLPPVTCTARNPVSSSNVTVQPAAACAGTKTAAFHPGNATRPDCRCFLFMHLIQMERLPSLRSPRTASRSQRAIPNLQAPHPIRLRRLRTGSSGGSSYQPSAPGDGGKGQKC
uniref:Immunoglobulin V-set domain-containing protein n=1 Tax=Nothoprocta perdicaria TaxID=30464 RepID=A0A8C6YLV0_NOTPE